MADQLHHLAQTLDRAVPGESPPPRGRRPSHPTHRPSHHPTLLESSTRSKPFRRNKATATQSCMTPPLDDRPRMVQHGWRGIPPNLSPGTTHMADQLHKLAHTLGKDITTISRPSTMGRRPSHPTHKPTPTQILFIGTKVTSTQSCITPPPPPPPPPLDDRPRTVGGPTTRPRPRHHLHRRPISPTCPNTRPRK
jgi:hypothetical protein